MVCEAYISHSRDGYELTIVEVPLWALAVERGGEWLCERTGNFLCGTHGWPYKVGIGARDEYGSPRLNLGDGLFAFGQWFHTIACQRERSRARIPVSTEWVEEHFPEQRIEFLERDSG